MEKEPMAAEHGKTCGYCGMNNHGFVWKRMALAILIGLFIFLLGIQIGEMRGSFGGYEGHMMTMHRGWDDEGQMMDDRSYPDQSGTTTIVVPAQPATPVTAPAPKQ